MLFSRLFGVTFLLCMTLCESASIVTTSAMIHHRLVERVNNNSSSIPTGAELSSAIIAQIKLRVHTQITSKISAKIFQKVKTSLNINASVMGTVVQVKNAEIEAIQTATVNGLQTQISQVIEKKFDQVISDKVTPSIDNLVGGVDQKVLTTSTLTNLLMQAETLVRSEIQVALPEIQKTLKSRINTKLKANIKDVQVDIPGLLKIQISAKINVTSSVKTVVQSVYKSFANVSVAVAVESYVKSILSKI